MNKRSDNTKEQLFAELEELRKKVEQNEEPLKKSEEKYRSLFENMLDGFALHEIVLDENGVPIDYIFLEVNNAFENQTGLKRAEIIGKKVTKVLPGIEKDPVDWIGVYGKVALNDESIRFEQYSKPLNKWYSILAYSPQKNNFATIFIDITKRKKAEQALKKNEEQLRNILENSTNLFYSHTVDHQITYVSPQVEDILGCTVEEAMRKWTDFASDNPINEIGFQNTVKAIKTGKRQPTYELELIRKDSKKIIVEVRESPVVENGKTVAIVGSLVDITERKQAQEALLKQERLSAIGELASGVAHDFNNSLQIIMGGVEMAMVSEEPEELNQYLESIKHSADDAASRIRQLQRFSKKSQSQKDVLPININNLAKDVIKETELFINQYYKKGVHIEVKSDFKAQSNIEGDEGDLRSCLFNLIKNGAEAMSEGGTITVSTDECDEKVYVSVSDTGVGMDEETQKKIFQPFYSTKGFEPGRGLGMTQVYSAIRDHKGNIYIKESEIGKGTVIELVIPVSRKELIPEKKEADYTGTANILWVDDEEMILKYGGDMLKMLGHTADLAADGNEALKLLAGGNKYDLIITDIGMPGMSGWQLAEQIKNKGYTTKVAIVTGWGIDVSQEDKCRYNVGYVLGKPIKLKDVKALIGEVLQMKDVSGKENKNE